MNKSKKLLNKIKSGKASLLDFSEFLELDEKYLEPFLNIAQKITQKNFDASSITMRKQTKRLCF